MPSLSSPKIAGMVFLSLGLFSVSSPAHAGFEWVAPPQGPQPYSGPSQDQAPSPAPSPISPVTIPATPSPDHPLAAPVSQTPASQILPYSSLGEGASYAPNSAPISEGPETISPIVIDGGHSAGPSVPVPAAAPSAIVSQSSDQGSLMPSPATATLSTADGPAFGAMPSSDPSLSNFSGDVVHGFANTVPLSVALREILPPGYGFALDSDVDKGTLVSFRGGKPWRETLQEMLDPAGLRMHEQNQMVSIGHGPHDHMLLPSSTGTALPSSGPVIDHRPLLGSAPHNLNSPLDVARASGAPTLANALPTNVPSSGSVGSVLEAWNAERGDSLHKVLEEWARRANVEFNWLAEYDYPLQASVGYTGTFEDAVRNILTGFETAHPQPIAELHANPTVNQMVLVVTTRGNNYSD
jgi:hypothetical protein